MWDIFSLSRSLQKQIFWSDESTKNWENAGNVLQWSALSSVSLQFRMIELVLGYDNELTPAMSLLQDPGRVDNLMFQEFVQR